MRPKSLLVGLAAAGLPATAAAQFPPTPLSYPNGPGAVPPVSAPYPAAPDPVGISPRPALPVQNTLWSYLGVSADQREYRRRAAMRTPAGQLRDRIRTPFTKLSGGLIPPFAPATPSLAELQAPGPIGAAAQVKLDRATAEDRMKAVEYLGTVDCKTWPEAEAALIGALRADRNECVRLKAATVLANGCCCTKKTIKALTLSATGSDCDGNPAEPSARVRAAAQTALDHCLACFCEVESHCPDKENCDKKPEPPPLPPLGPAPKKDDNTEGGPKTGPGNSGGGAAAPRVTPDAYYDRVAKTPAAEVVAEARKALSVRIPVDAPGPGINPHDLEAAGDPAATDAAGRSPRQVSLLNLVTGTRPAPAGIDLPSRPAAAARPTTPAMTAAAAPVPQPAPMAVSTPAPPSRPMTPPVRPTTPAMTAANAPVAPPAAVRPNPAPVAAKPAVVTRPAPLPVAAPVPPPAPVVRAESRADKVAGMFVAVVPIADLAAGIDGLTADDLRAAPGLVGELVGTGCGRTTPAPIRLASARALVRCRVATPEAAAALRGLAEADPDPAVREAARSGGK